MTISVDTDGDGKPEATFPVKWFVMALTAILTGCSAFGPMLL